MRWGAARGWSCGAVVNSGAPIGDKHRVQNHPKTRPVELVPEDTLRLSVGLHCMKDDWVFSLAPRTVLREMQALNHSPNKFWEPA